MPRITRSFLLALATISATVHAAPAHVHGEGVLNLTIDRNQISVSIEAPLEGFLGFEHLPRSAQEKQNYSNMLRLLEDPAALFHPTPAASCTPGLAKVAEPFPGGKPKPEGHADIDADYTFVCAKPEALKGIGTSLFSTFPKLQKLNVQRVGPSGQGATMLTPKNPSITW